MDPDHVRHIVGPDLRPNCVTRRQRVKLKLDIIAFADNKFKNGYMNDIDFSWVHVSLFGWCIAA